MIRRLLPSFVAAGVMLLAAAAWAQAPGAPGAPAPTAAQAQQALSVLQNPQQRARLIQNLQTIAQAAPAPAAAAKPGVVAPNGLGAQLVARLSGWSGRLAAAAADTAAQLSKAPALWRSLMHVTEDSSARTGLTAAAWRIALILVCAGIAEAAARWILRRPARTLAARAPGPDHPHSTWDLLRRLPFALAGLVLSLIPVAVFAAVGNLLAGIVAGTGQATALVAVAAVNAYAIGRAILCGGRLLAAPGAPRLRLLPLGDDGAGAVMGWLRRITIAAVVGSALAQIAVLLGLPVATHDALIRLTALAVAVMLIWMVLAYRRPAARFIRGEAAATETAEWRRWLAETWHYLAIAAIVGAWLILVGGVHPGRDTLDFLIGTLAVLIGARLLAIVVLGAVARALPGGPSEPGRGYAIGMRAARYQRVVRIAVISVITAAAAVALLQLWGADAIAWFTPGGVGQHLLSALITVALAAAIAIVVWESANTAIDREIDRLHDVEPMRSARLRTLLPLMRTTLLVTIVVVVGATALSEIGVNIAPLLAGAGIVGIAVGFGAQTLVHDIITGMFILIENTIQVGDGVTVAGLSGTVEKLSIRTLRLRAADGSLHVIPFSSVVTITNTNRGIGNAAVTITVAADQDVDRVGAVLSAIGEELRADPDFAPMILGDFTFWGVDMIRSTGVALSGQIPCTVSGRMPVQREFNRRLLKRFAEANITLASPP